MTAHLKKLFLSAIKFIMKKISSILMVFAVGLLAGAVATLLLLFLVVEQEGVVDWMQFRADGAAIYFSAVLLLIVAFGGFSLYRRLKKESDLFGPIRQASKQVASGDYAVHLPVNGGDELSELHRTFNDMCRVLTETVDKLEKQNERLETVLSTMTSGILAVDMDLRVTMVNQAAQSMLLCGEEALGQ